MFNQILWTLDNEMDDAEFERLCTDLLGREGYKDIVPIGGSHDRGRDAESRLRKMLKPGRR
jgi:Restriction endonuclease